MAVRILDEALVNTIAAGEVVERPASVVKELVENALDAGASRLRVELRAGGRSLVRVADDGCGMNRADALMCLERHATSKIRSADDLFAIGTLGFRGEAIPSIASVSRFDLVTREADADIGTRVRVEGGRVLDVGPTGSPAGTEVSVASLFFNVPARRKFLRSVETELGHCAEAVIRVALLREDVDFELVHDDRTVFHAARTPERARRAADLLGAHGTALVPVAFERGTMSVRALVSPVGVHRQNPTGTSYLYVNGRFVRDLVLRRAITAAYAGIVPKDRHPTVILDLRVPPAEVDVNVHPAKTEVRFAHAYELQNALTAGLRNALQEHGIHKPVEAEARYRPAPPPQPAGTQIGLGLRAADVQAQVLRVAAPAAPSVPPAARAPSAVPTITAPASRATEARSEHAIQGAGPRAVDPSADRRAPSAWVTTDAAPAPIRLTERPAEPFAEAAGPAAAAPVTRLSGSEHAGGVAGGGAPPAKDAAPEPAEEAGVAPTAAPAARGADPLLPVPRYADLRVLGQVARTYIVCEGAGELVIVDQHAAHERVVLWRLRQEPQAALGGAQRMLVPVVVQLSTARARHLAGALEQLSAFGLDVSPLGAASFAVQAAPAALARDDLGALLADLADELAEGGGPSAVVERLEKALATCACHNSVRAGQVLDHDGMRAILVALDEVDFSVCAHGRPVAIRVPPGELERRFHRA